MNATDRLHSERIFHDRQALDRARTFQQHPEKLRFDDDTYLDHETWIRPAFERLGDVRGLRVLDLGCGHGMAAVILARRGAQVAALELSSGYLHEARQRAEANGVRIDLVQGDGDKLPFADVAFDRIWGSAILHHLDLETGGREIFRVLRPGGVAVFCEPWGENPFLRWARERFYYPGKERTVDEQPLRHRQVGALRGIFPTVEMSGFQLLSMARRLLPAGRMTASLERCDGLLLSKLPGLQRFCRYIVLTLKR